MTEHELKGASLADTCAGAYEFFAQTSVEPGKACLLQIYPARSDSEMMRLTRERTLIGREPSCEISVDDDAISRTHAAVDLLEGRYFLVDLNSTNGTYVDDALLCGRMPLSGGELIRIGGCIMKFMSSMDEEENYHAVVHELMTRDALTNAFNRSYLIPVIDKELELCRKQNGQLSLILLDIDYFKNINDQYGHLVGDEVLRIFCERVRGELRTSDLLTRFGGEEFIVACCRTPLQDAGRIAERIRLAIASVPFQTHGGNINVTCSLGVSTSDGVELASCDQMVSAADALLYDAKKSGRNRVRMFDSQKTRCDGKPSQVHSADCGRSQ
jgi:two-component system cell cycle response regulator